MSMIVTAPGSREGLAQVGAPAVKKDAAALLEGKPVFTDDLAPADALVVKILHSPHAFARIRSIDTSRALKVPGVVAVYTYRDVPRRRFTLAGQSYPEASPYDRLILDEVVRYVGDEVAIVAAEDADAADRALRLIRVDYELMEPVLDFTEAIDNPSVIHAEDDYHVNGAWIRNDRMRNIVSSGLSEHGDLDAAFAASDVVLERTYHTLADAQAMMETFRAFTEIDAYGRLTVTSSTQVPFHVRRMVAGALDIPQARVRVVKPRIGGGFGAKQSGCVEIFTAFVTAMTGRPSKIVYTREETLTASNSRHEMQMRVRIGARRDGTILALDLHTLSNQGAYGEHGPTTVGLSGHKSLPLYNRVLASRFSFDVVYTNTMPAGAYRGYGATQGLFAVESAVNELADKLRMDPCEIRLKNLVREGEVMPQYYDNTLYSCSAATCLTRAMEMIGWEDKELRRDMGDRVRGLGVALSMQGSAIAGIDIASVDLRLEESGFYTLSIGATDMGTGCDTVLAQFAAEALGCDLDRIVVHGVDTDVSPFDTGSYASASTYLTGMAVVKAAEQLIARLRAEAARLLGADVRDVSFEGDVLRAYPAGVLGDDGALPPEFSAIDDDVEAIARPYRLVRVAPEAEPVGDLPARARRQARRRRGRRLPDRPCGGELAHEPPAVHERHRRGRRRQGDRRGDRGGLRERGRLRHGGQREPCARAGRGRHRPGDRHGAHRGRAVRRARPHAHALVHDLQGAHPARHPAGARGVRPELRAHGPVRREVHRRGRHQHPVAGHRERGGARHGQLRAHPADHAREGPLRRVTSARGRPHRRPGPRPAAASPGAVALRAARGGDRPAPRARRGPLCASRERADLRELSRAHAGRIWYHA